MTDENRTIADLMAEVEIPKDGITSRALVSNENVRIVIFGFDAGQELSEHTASVPAIIHILSGAATLALGNEVHEASAGSLAYMPANLSHRVVAKAPMVMLLTMLKSAKTAGGPGE